MNIGQRIRDRRLQLRMTMRDLAQQAKLSIGFICDLEGGKKSVSVKNAEKLAAALGVSAADLVGERPSTSTIRGLSEASRTITEWLEAERESLADFHAYAQRFGGRPGSSVYLFVLSDALAYRGLTLEQFREASKEEQPK